MSLCHCTFTAMDFTTEGDYRELQTVVDVMWMGDGLDGAHHLKHNIPGWMDGWMDVDGSVEINMEVLLSWHQMRGGHSAVGVPCGSVEGGRSRARVLLKSPFILFWMGRDQGTEIPPTVDLLSSIQVHVALQCQLPKDLRQESDAGTSWLESCVECAIGSLLKR